MGFLARINLSNQDLTISNRSNGASNSNGESLSSLRRWRQVLSMLNWRQEPGYELRVMHYEQRKMQHELRMKQLKGKIEQIEKETEQL